MNSHGLRKMAAPCCLIAALLWAPRLCAGESRERLTEDFRNDLLTSGISVICVKRILNADYPDSEKLGRAITAKYKSLGQDTIMNMAATLIAGGLVFEKEFSLKTCADALPLSIAECEKYGLDTGLMKKALQRISD